MIAALGMYDRAETAPANDRLWALIRDALRDGGIAAPDALTRGDGAYWPAWQSPDLVLAQTCGLPLRAVLHRDVTLVGTPDYALDGCAPGHYRSVFVARADDVRKTASDFAGARFAFNEGLSQSGWAAPKAWFDEHGLGLAPTMETGGHRASARAVMDGRADFAAIDAVTWWLITRYDDWSGGLQVIGTTGTSPALPFISAKGADPEPIFAALSQAVAALSPEDRTTLHLRGVVRMSLESYLAVPVPAPPDQFAQAN